jgi:hypothetical protein
MFGYSQLKRFGALSVSMALYACASTGPKVIERADSLSSAPDWASVTKGAYEKEGKHFFLGYITLNEGASKSAAMNMADEKALSEPMRAIVKEFLDQNQVGESVNQGDAVGQRVISATRGYRPPMPGLHITNRYWETVMVPTVDGKPRIELRVYSLAGIPSSEYAEAKKAALQNLSGNNEVKKILDDVGARQRDAVLGGSKSESGSASNK